MSSSLNTETELREMAEKLTIESCALREAADVLQNRREQEELLNQETINMKERVRRWLK